MSLLECLLKSKKLTTIRKGIWGYIDNSANGCFCLTSFIGHRVTPQGFSPHYFSILP